jgi:type I restriction enzyme S subunit
MPDKLVSSQEVSGYSLLGNLPVEWRIGTIGSIAHLITKGTTPTTYGYAYTAEGILFLRVENITEDGQVGTGEPFFIAPATHQFMRRSQLEAGDVLVSIAGTIGRTAFIHASDLPANINQALALVRIDKSRTDPAFLCAFLRSQVGQRLLLGQTVQLAQANISLTQIASTNIPLPPLPEQRRIADILDTVDAAIQQTEALIAKLKLMKAGLLHDLLTRGLDEQGHLRDPNAHPEQFKDSPLGRIPREWDAVPIDFIAAYVGSGITPFGGSKVYVQDGIPLIRSQNVTFDGLLLVLSPEGF